MSSSCSLAKLIFCVTNCSRRSEPGRGEQVGIRRRGCRARCRSAPRAGDPQPRRRPVPRGAGCVPFGHRWMLATHTEDMSEQELQRRMEEVWRENLRRISCRSTRRTIAARIAGLLQCRRVVSSSLCSLRSTSRDERVPRVGKDADSGATPVGRKIRRSLISARQIRHASWRSETRSARAAAATEPEAERRCHSSCSAIITRSARPTSSDRVDASSRSARRRPRRRRGQDRRSGREAPDVDRRGVAHRTARPAKPAPDRRANRPAALGDVQAARSPPVGSEALRPADADLSRTGNAPSE